ncbi:MAG: glycosyltransferase [Candidatus Obscuribacterales bacterium]|nr:glycosyltransferase [Candidatus Obscuribacterales bacterium]
MKKSLYLITHKNYANRVHHLAGSLDTEATFYEIDRSRSRWHELKEIWEIIKSEKWDFIFLEGTSIAGGINLIRAYLEWKQPYIVSSGDPISGYFSVTRNAFLGSLFELYERALYLGAKGYVGWTPYLTGMALKMGVPRGITLIAVDFNIFFPLTEQERQAERKRLGIEAGQIVCGVVGSLNWSKKQAYCYGLELTETLKRLNRTDVSFVIVGDGNGKKLLEDSIPAHLKSRVIFTGNLPQNEVCKIINIMDIGFVTQTLDQLGSFRLSTKLGEYLACGVPIAMSPVPGFYDYAEPAGWALPPYHPASTNFHSECAAWLDKLTRDEIAAKAKETKKLALNYFSYTDVKRKFKAFVESLN